MKLIHVITAAAVCIPVTAAAQTERDLESHVHGAAELNVVVADSEVFIELATPWNNLVGFEHTPQTEAQHALVRDALEILNSPEQLFSFSGGNCTSTDFQIDSAMSLEVKADEHGDEHGKEHDSDEHHEEHDDAHGEEHDGDEHHDEHDGDEHHDEHNEHNDEHEAHSDSPQTHTSILATYSYECSDIDTLSSIELLLFSVWPGFVDLDVQLVGESKQEFVELNPQNTVLLISEVQ